MPPGLVRLSAFPHFHACRLDVTVLEQSSERLTLHLSRKAAQFVKVLLLVPSPVPSGFLPKSDQTSCDCRAPPRCWTIMLMALP